MSDRQCPGLGVHAGLGNIPRPPSQKENKHSKRFTNASEHERPRELGKKQAVAGRSVHIWRWGWGGPWASSARLAVLASAGLDWNPEPPSGGSGQPAGTVNRQGGRTLVPVWVAPRQLGVNLLIWWESFQNPPPSPCLLRAGLFRNWNQQDARPRQPQWDPARVYLLWGGPGGLGGAECAARAGQATWRPGSLPASREPPCPRPGTCSPARGSTWARPRPRPRGGWNPAPPLTTSETLSTPLNLRSFEFQSLSL